MRFHCLICLCVTIHCTTPSLGSDPDPSQSSDPRLGSNPRLGSGSDLDPRLGREASRASGGRFQGTCASEARAELGSEARTPPKLDASGGQCRLMMHESKRVCLKQDNLGLDQDKLYESIRHQSRLSLGLLRLVTKVNRCTIPAIARLACGQWGW